MEKSQIFFYKAIKVYNDVFTKFTLWHAIYLERLDIKILYLPIIYKVVLNIVMQPGNTYKAL